MLKKLSLIFSVLCLSSCASLSPSAPSVRIYLLDGEHHSLIRSQTKENIEITTLKESWVCERSDELKALLLYLEQKESQK